MITTSLPFRTKIALGVGATAFGIKESGLSMFLLIYYGQVLGLGEFRVGMALLIGLVIDALTDPLVGHFSDHLRSGWGRRHPLMYASAVPIHVFSVLLWNPPSGLSEDALFAYLLLAVAAVRVSTTFHEIPNGALVAELTLHYHERTKAFAYRFLFGWSGGLMMSVLTFSVLLHAGEAGQGQGPFAPSGFRTYGWVAASAMFCSVLLSALGTHSAIPRLRELARGRAPSEGLGTNRRASWGLWGSPALRPLLKATVTTTLASGLSQGLQLHVSTYFWRLRPEEIALFPLAFLASTFFAFTLVAPISRALGKRRTAQWSNALGFLCQASPLLLCIAGAFPHRDQPLFIPLLIIAATLGTACQITAGISSASLLSDVVEEREVHTGKRSEGAVMATSTLVSKLTLGLGMFASGFLLSQVGFPRDAVPGGVAPATLNALVLSQVGITALLTVAGILALRSPALSPTVHAAHLSILQAREKPSSA